MVAKMVEAVVPRTHPLALEVAAVALAHAENCLEEHEVERHRHNRYCYHLRLAAHLLLGSGC